jgi:phosphoenolpyruvate synthase/pyruvate phosphate dikinase
MIISIEDFDKLKLSGRSYLNQMFFEEAGFIKSFTSKIGEQVGVDKSDLLNYGISELIDLVTKGIKLSSQQIKDRALFFHSKDLTLFGSESKILTNQFLSIYREISNIIKGSIANKGKATGKARVLVPDWKDFDKIAIAVKEMEEGEILVAETTSPDIITACKKASAIITNQGGMLSHAAIVSRELGIPCIIGTDKDVILNIKTGDKLEVDADNGIIKILNKN